MEPTKGVTGKYLISDGQRFRMDFKKPYTEILTAQSTGKTELPFFDPNEDLRYINKELYSEYAMEDNMDSLDFFEQRFHENTRSRGQLGWLRSDGKNSKKIVEVACYNPLQLNSVGNYFKFQELIMFSNSFLAQQYRTTFYNIVLLNNIGSDSLLRGLISTQSHPNIEEKFEDLRGTLINDLDIQGTKMLRNAIFKLEEEGYFYGFFGELYLYYFEKNKSKYYPLEVGLEIKNNGKFKTAIKGRYSNGFTYNELGKLFRDIRGKSGFRSLINKDYIFKHKINLYDFNKTIKKIG